MNQTMMGRQICVAFLWGLFLFLFAQNAYTNAADVKLTELPLAKQLTMKKTVAIVGAGAGGSSSAWHLHKLAEEHDLDITIDVFEKNDYIGGRTTTVNVWNDSLKRVELGASIFVKVNTIMVDAMHELGLHPSVNQDHDDSSLLGIWNGEKFVLTISDNESGWWTGLKMIYKYGLSPIRTQRAMKKTVGLFTKLYEAPFFPFRSLTSRSRDLGLTQIIAQTGKEFLTANKISKAFANDLIQASTRVNYAQNLGQIHGLETMVCMAIEGQIQVAGGNWQIFSRMVNASQATLHLETKVQSISKRDGKYAMKYSSIADASAVQERLYDTVIIAAPFQYADLTIEDGIARHLPDSIPYVELHVTLFTTRNSLSSSYFGLEDGDKVPDTILTTLSDDEDPSDRDNIVGKAGLFSISTLRKMTNPVTGVNETLYKIFSPTAMTASQLGKLFDMTLPDNLSSVPTSAPELLSWYYAKVWHSYPYEYPRITFEDPELARGLYYTSGMESFISTMETMALMGKNVAQLVVDDYRELDMQHGKNSDRANDGAGQNEL